MHRVRSGDRGAVTLEAVLIFPAALALIMAALSAALWLYARDIALSAARQGLADARDAGASPASGGSAAVTFARRAGGAFLGGPSAVVTVTGSTTTGGTVTIIVTGHALSLIPWWHPAVTQAAQAPLEVFSTPQDGAS